MKPSSFFIYIGSIMGDMAFGWTQLQNLKETLLVVSVLYFYTLAIALTFKADTYGLDTSVVFVIMGSMFLAALGLETALTWWKKRVALLWFLITIICYGVIGLYVGPIFYGDWIIPYVTFAPLVMVFFGGFVYSYLKIFVKTFSKEQEFRANHLNDVLLGMPGWSYQRGSLVKTYAFSSFSDALNFANLIYRAVKMNGHYPDELHIESARLTIGFSGNGLRKVSLKDISTAKIIDAI